MSSPLSANGSAAAGLLRLCLGLCFIRGRGLRPDLAIEGEGREIGHQRRRLQLFWQRCYGRLLQLQLGGQVQLPRPVLLHLPPAVLFGPARRKHQGVCQAHTRVAQRGRVEGTWTPGIIKHVLRSQHSQRRAAAADGIHSAVSTMSATCVLHLTSFQPPPGPLG